MARTAQGAQLTEAHRAAQLAARAGSLRQLVDLWRVVDPLHLADTIETFARAAAILAGQGYEQSGVISARYYSLFRSVEIGVPGPPVRAERRPGVDVLASEIRGAALSGVITARRSGLTVPQAAQRGLVRAAGALGKLILNGGRRTIITATMADKQALGWARVTSGGACAFCKMLAARGPAYKSAKAADFESHGSCGCSAEVVFKGGDGPLQSDTYAAEWKAAQAAAQKDGTMSSGTSNDALNNFRRYLAGGATAGPSPVTEESGQ
jgi:hypothetical protein